MTIKQKRLSKYNCAFCGYEHDAQRITLQYPPVYRVSLNGWDDGNKLEFCSERCLILSALDKLIK